MSRHCAACHSLPIEGIADHREATVAIDRKPQETMPHGLAAEEMRRFLEQTYLEKAVRALTARFWTAACPTDQL